MGNFKNVIGEMFAENTNLFLCTHGFPRARKRHEQRYSCMMKDLREHKRIDRAIAREENGELREASQRGKTFDEHRVIDAPKTTMATVENESSAAWARECARVRKMLK